MSAARRLSVAPGLMAAVAIALLLTLLGPPGWVILVMVVLVLLPGRWWRWRTRRYRRGLKLVRRGDAAAAQREFETFLAEIRRDDRFARLQPYFNLGRIYPYEAAAESNLGVSDLLLGRPVEGLARFRSALRLSPDWPQAQFGEACALRLTGDLPAAEPAARRAIRLRGTYVPARLLLALILRELGGPAREAEAEEVVEPLRSAGKDPEVLLARMREQWPGG